MKRLLLLSTFLFLFQNSFSQVINVNTTTYTVPQLVQNVLFGSSASASCAGTVSNITWSTGTNFGSTNGIGYFTNTNPGFPLANGVILSTGNVTAAPGPNTSTQSNGSFTWTGDAQLFNYIQGLGIDPGLTSYNNASILEFDFVPLSSTMSFDFLFASEEYGTFQCEYSDAFAFFLTNVTTASIPVNLALVPGTTDPVSVRTIRDDANNSTCASVNPTFFGSYTLSPSAAASAAPTNFNGLTIKMTANSTVVPNDLYHIKLVIADRNDSAYDSAVFLGGGSFNIGSEITSGSGFNNPNYTIADGTAVCFGGSRDIVFGASPIPGAVYSWYSGTTLLFSGPSNVYSVTQPGNYTVSVQLPSGCQYNSTNTFIVEFYPALPLAQPLDLTQATGIFNLGSNTPVMLNGQSPADYDISYHLTLADAQNIANPIANLSTFPGTNGQIIYVAIQDLIGAGCTEIRSFVLYTSCSSITLPSSNQTICTGSDPTAFSVNTTFTGSNAISYVYFNSAQTADNMYTGGTLLGYTTPNASGIATYDASVLGSAGSLPNSPGNYYVYAIADPAPADTTCRPYQLIQVVVNPGATLTLTSAAATTAQTVCVNSAITNITYTFGGTATGATVTGLPVGITASTTGTTVTISGSSSAAGTYPYTIFTTGGACGSPSLTGTITIQPLATIALTSAAPTANQTVCVNSAITNITYDFGGTATGATVTGLPIGVTASTTGTTVTISGNPSTVGTFPYTITTTGGACGTPSLTGTITVQPLATLTLTSAAATTAQTVCVNSAITNITYTFGGTATGATVTGLPVGITASTTGTTVTISGSSSAAGTYPYTISTTGGACGAPSLTGTITIQPLATIALTSAAPTANQTVCVNSAITNITYDFGGTATGATVTGLPIGVTASTTGTTVTISGNPSTVGTFPYTITTTGGACGTPSLTGTITVQPLATLTLTSAAATTAQTVCVNATITNITYTFGGTATGATVTGLPVGITASTTGTTVTISGSSSAAGTYPYTISTTGGACGAPSLTGTITIQPLATIVLTSAAPTANQTVCVNSAITNITYDFGGTATGATVTGLPTGVTASTTGTTVTISGNPSAVGTFPYTITTTGGACGTPSLTGTITVQPLATLTLTSAAATTAQTVCVNATITNITYTFGGTATGATVTGLPVGIAASTTGTTVTISGSSSAAGTYPYTISTTGGNCGSPSLTGTITIQPLATIVLTSAAPTANQTVCVNSSITAITYDFGGTATGISVSPLPSGVTSSVTGNTLTISGTPNTASATPYAYTVTTTGGTCGTPSLTGSIKVISAPVASTPTSYQVCDDNSDGVSCLFVLNTKDTEVTTTSGLSITYHLTITDAQNGLNPIPKNIAYCNINNPQDIYVRLIDPSAPACYSTTSFQLIVNPKPLITTVPDYPLCDNNNSGDGFEQFNLPTKDFQIINGQPSMVVTYYLTQGNATNQVSPLSSLYTNVVANTQTIWYNIKNTVTGCTSVGSLNLVVNPLPVITVNSPTVCQGDTATLTATPAVTATYFYAWSVPFGVTNPGNVASFTTTVAGVYSVIATNTVTGCVGASASGTVTLITAPTISTPTNYVVCDDNTDGVSCLFVLGTKDVEISTQPGIQITYHLTLTDAQTGSNPIPKNTPYCNIANPQRIYVRVFDPSAPACSSYTTFELIVNPKPVAHTPNDYHLCDTNPSTSVSEATFDLTTVVTPQVLGNQSSGSFTVTYYTTLANAQAPSNAIAPSLASAYTTSSTTLWIRIQNNTTGCYDITSVNLVVDALPTALAFYPQYELCETVAPIGVETFNLTSQIPAILQGQNGMQVTFYPTLAQAQAGVGAIVNPSAYNNTPPYAQTIGIRITNTATGCYAIATMDLVVNPKPVPIAPTSPYTLCDNDQDGFTCFDLTTLTPGILFQTPGVYTITYHLTQTDAEQANNDIPNASNYCNNNAFVQFLWVRAENPITHCYAVMPIELNVYPAPNLPNPALSPIANCDADSNPQDGCTGFDLTQQTPIILAAQPLVTATYTVTYYTSSSNASATPSGLFPIIQTTNYVSCSPTATIWYRVENIASHCFVVGSFQIQVNTPIVLTTPTQMNLCDNDSQPNDLHTTFNMSGFVGPVAGHTLYFYLDAAHTQLITNPSAFVNTQAASQTVFIVAVDNITGCKSYRTLTVVVLPIPTPRTNLSAMPLVSCDTNNPNDGYEVFDLTTNAAYIANGDPNVTLHYFPSYNDAVNNTLEFIPATAANVNQNVWIRVESNYNIDYHGEHCYVLVEQPIKVNPLPLITPNVVYQECDDDTDGYTLFNLNSQAANLLSTNALPLSNYTLAFYLDSGLTQPINNPNNFTNTNTTGNTQVIYVVATNTITGCKSPVSSFTIMVNPKPTLTPPSNFATCDDEPNDNDGYYLYPLDVLIPGILNGQLPADYTVSFYNTQAEATNAVNAFIDLPNYQAHTQTIWIRVENNVTHCARIGSFNVIVEQEPQPLITADTNVICVDFNTHQVVRDLVLTATNTTGYLSGTTIPTYTYQWFDAAGVAIPGATASTYLVDYTFADNISTHFSVVMTSTSTLGCSAPSPDYTVLQSGQAVAVPAGTSGYVITNAFSENQTITVTVDGYGTYLYSLDDGPRQASNVFENVPLGGHYVTVWDSEGGVATSCDPLVLSGIQAIDYPHYFTPNGDGINDTWNIVGLSTQLNAKIYIFDRQGKLIKQISPQSQGWDGTYNGNLMPATDYWFTVYYSEAEAIKEFKAHFSLKR